MVALRGDHCHPLFDGAESNSDGALVKKDGGSVTVLERGKRRATAIQPCPQLHSKSLHFLHTSIMCCRRSYSGPRRIEY